jgi:lipopolysaccharide transport system ATP-binding protein
VNGRIVLSGVGKAYRHYADPRQRLLEWFSLGTLNRHQARWALRDITLDIAPGDAVGVIGANGAGKSTLLKLITGTTRPTTGQITAEGRVAALLELGIGFHPDVTGRDNVSIAGQLLGFGIQEIAARMPEIEQFAEIGEYLDLPVRTYSSGMQVRLAFSVATAIRPDILIVDEALAVGDAYFQHKSFARIREFRAEGTTLLFVSHSAPIIKSICDRAVLLENGAILRDGIPEAVLDYYHARVASRTLRYEITATDSGGTRSGDRRASIEEVALIHDGAPVHVIRSNAPAIIRVRLRALDAVDDLTVGFMIRDVLGNAIYGTNTYHLQHRKFDLGPGAGYVCEFDIPRFALGAGHYNMSIALHSDMTHVSGNYDWWDRALTFEVVPGHPEYGFGVIALDVSCRMEALPATERCVQ